MGRNLRKGHTLCKPIIEPNNDPLHIPDELVHYTIESALNACRSYHSRILEDCKETISRMVKTIKDSDKMDVRVQRTLPPLRFLIAHIKEKKRALERVRKENYVSGEPF